MRPPVSVIRTRPSISGACERIRPSTRYSLSSLGPSTIASTVRPRSARSLPRAIGCWSDSRKSFRRSFSSAGTGSPRGSEPEPGSGEYVKAPTLSSSARRTNSQSSANSASPSPGNPTMKVVRMAIPGTRSRIRAAIAR